MAYSIYDKGSRGFDWAPFRRRKLKAQLVVFALRDLMRGGYVNSPLARLLAGKKSRVDDTRRFLWALESENFIPRKTWKDYRRNGIYYYYVGNDLRAFVLTDWRRRRFCLRDGEWQLLKKLTGGNQGAMEPATATAASAAQKA